MGIRDLFAYGRIAAGAPALPGSPRDLRSPWTVGELSRIVAGDVFGVDALPLTRAEAMSVPAVARGRHLIAGALAESPLRLLRGGDLVDPQPAWLNPQAPGVSAWHRALWTADDLLFGGWSLWALRRDDAGAIADAVRVPAERWHFDPADGHLVYVDEDGVESPVDAASALLIPGPHEGLLTFAATTLRTAATIEAAVADRAHNPVPMTELHESEPGQLDEVEVDVLLDRWRTARASRGGAVGFTPYGIDLRTHGDAAGDFLIAARNAAAIDAARHLGIPAAMIDASNVNSTLTYETLQGRDLQFHAHTVRLYAGAIAARLSLDDVCPPGERVVVDTSALTVNPPTPTGPTLED